MDTDLNAKTEQSQRTLKYRSRSNIHDCIQEVTKTRLFKYIETFTSKTENFQIKNSNIFHISPQNIDCGYSLETPRRGGSNEYP